MYKVTQNKMSHQKKMQFLDNRYRFFTKILDFQLNKTDNF